MFLNEHRPRLIGVSKVLDRFLRWFRCVQRSMFAFRTSPDFTKSFGRLLVGLRSKTSLGYAPGEWLENPTRSVNLL
jgi:hypothetical protein